MVEFGRSHIDDFESFIPAGIDPIKPHHEFVLAHNGRDKLALWSFDKQNGEFGELIRARNDIDVWGTFNHSNQLAHYGEVAGFMEVKDRINYEFFPEHQREEAIHAQFSNVIEDAFTTRVVSVSRDGQSMVVRNSGPQAVPSFYLFRNGQFQFIGTMLPEVNGEDLSPTTYIEYPARDGLTIPGHLTTPAHGEPPYPLVVLPHGGPFVPEVIGFDLGRSCSRITAIWCCNHNIAVRLTSDWTFTNRPLWRRVKPGLPCKTTKTTVLCI